MVEKKQVFAIDPSNYLVIVFNKHLRFNVGFNSNYLPEKQLVCPFGGHLFPAGVSFSQTNLFPH